MSDNNFKKLGNRTRGVIQVEPGGTAVLQPHTRFSEGVPPGLQWQIAEFLDFNRRRMINSADANLRRRRTAAPQLR